MWKEWKKKKKNILQALSGAKFMILVADKRTSMGTVDEGAMMTTTKDMLLLQNHNTES